MRGCVGRSARQRSLRLQLVVDHAKLPKTTNKIADPLASFISPFECGLSLDEAAAFAPATGLTVTPAASSIVSTLLTDGYGFLERRFQR